MPSISLCRNNLPIRAKRGTRTSRLVFRECRLGKEGDHQHSIQTNGPISLLSRSHSTSRARCEAAEAVHPLSIASSILIMVKGMVEEASNGSRMTMATPIAKAIPTTGVSPTPTRLTRTFTSSSWAIKERSTTNQACGKKRETSIWSQQRTTRSIKPMMLMSTLSTSSISCKAFLSRKKVSAIRTSLRRLGTMLLSPDPMRVTKAPCLSICTSSTPQIRQCKASACNSNNGAKLPTTRGATTTPRSTIINTKSAEVSPVLSTSKLQPTGSTIRETITIRQKARGAAAGTSHQDRPPAVAKAANGTTHRVAAGSSPLMRCHTTAM